LKARGINQPGRYRGQKKKMGTRVQRKRDLTERQRRNNLSWGTRGAPEEVDGEEVSYKTKTTTREAPGVSGNGLKRFEHCVLETAVKGGGGKKAEGESLSRQRTADK